MGWMSTRSQPDYNSALAKGRCPIWAGVTTAKELLPKPLKITSAFGSIEQIS